jgi:uncharacterized membrane protein YfcA
VEAGELLGALVVGIAAGVASGLLGIGGGVLFVPGLVLFLDQTVLEAEATSLVAIVIVAVVGAWRQRGYGNLRLRDAAVIGLLSPAGVLGGTALANALSDRTLELGFAGVQLYFAFELVRRARASGGVTPES